MYKCFKYAQLVPCWHNYNPSCQLLRANYHLTKYIPSRHTPIEWYMIGLHVVFFKGILKNQVL